MHPDRVYLVILYYVGGYEGDYYPDSIHAYKSAERALKVKIRTQRFIDYAESQPHSWPLLPFEHFRDRKVTIDTMVAK